MPQPRLHANTAARVRAHRARQRLAAIAPHVPCRQIGSCTLYCSDWQTIYPLLPRHAAVITDPPYNVNYDYTKTRRRPAQWDYNFVGADQPFDPSPWLRFPEVILFGADQYWDARFLQGTWCYWDKMVGKPSADFAPGEWIWLSTPGPPQSFQHLWRGGMRAGEENYVHLPQKQVVSLNARDEVLPAEFNKIRGSQRTQVP